jgi:hypothetical protein
MALSIYRVIVVLLALLFAAGLGGVWYCFIHSDPDFDPANFRFLALESAVVGLAANLGLLASPFVVNRSWRARMVVSALMFPSTTSCFCIMSLGFFAWWSSPLLLAAATYIAQQLLLLRQIPPEWARPAPANSALQPPGAPGSD